MADTYSQIYIHIIFSVKRRESLIKEVWEEKLYKFVTGIVQNNNQKMIAINGMPDHIHFLIGMKPECKLSDLVREIKKSTNKFINDNVVKYKFEWQSGYGAFSYHKSMVDRVVKYIMNQKQHHRIKTFKEEYLELLKNFEIEYQDKYIFDWIDY